MTKEQKPVNLNDLFLELFTPEFLASMPSEQLEVVIGNLRRVESEDGAIPPQWLALKNVLQRRGYLDEG